jgi:hypothetical protein
MSPNLLCKTICKSHLSKKKYTDWQYSYQQSVLGHNSRLVAENSKQPNAGKRLRRQWPSDLPQPADEESSSHHSPAIGLIRVSSLDDFSTQETQLEQIYSLLKKTSVDCKYIIYK